MSQRTEVLVTQPQTKQPEERQHPQSESSKVIIQRFLLEDGNVTFAVGTKNGEHITRDAGEVPLRDIFHHVTSAELERFENRDFIGGDEREERERRLKLLRKKAPGRPRKYPVPDVTSAEPSSGLSSKRPRGRPRKNVVSVPSFNGPQPGLGVRIPMGLGPSAVAPYSASSSAIESTQRRQQYSMVAASGLAPPETSEEETSREVSMAISPDPGPSSKRRKVESSDTLHYRASTSTPMVRIPLSARPKAFMVAPQPVHEPVAYKLVDLTGDSDSEEVDTIKPLPRTYDGPQDQSPNLETDEEREALLRQFQTRPIRRSSPASSSSSAGSLMGSIAVHRRSHPQALRAQQMQPDSLGRSFPATGRPGASIASRPLDSRVGDVKSRTDQASQQTPHRKSRPRNVSLTPHFPHGMTYNRNSYNPTDIRPVSSTSTRNNNSSKPSQTHTFPNKWKLSPEPIAHIHSNPRPLRTPTSNLLKPLIPTKDITKFFRPRSSPVKASQPTASKDDKRGEDYSDEESDDLIAHSSSPDSPSTEVHVVPRHARVDTSTPGVVADSQDGPNVQLTTNQSEEANSNSDSSNDDESIELELASDNVVPALTVGSTRNPLEDLDMNHASEEGYQSSADENNEDETSESDSLSSEVLVVRRK